MFTFYCHVTCATKTLLRHPSLTYPKCTEQRKNSDMKIFRKTVRKYRKKEVKKLENVNVTCFTKQE